MKRYYISSEVDQILYSHSYSREQISALLKFYKKELEEIGLDSAIPAYALDFERMYIEWAIFFDSNEDLMYYKLLDLHGKRMNLYLKEDLKCEMI